MKICVFPCSNKGGIDTYTGEIARVLHERTRHEIYTFGDAEIRSRRGKINRIESGLDNLGKCNFDLIHCASPPMLAHLRTSVPTVVTAWFYPYAHTRSLWITWKAYAWWKFPVISILRLRGNLYDRMGYAKAKKIICVTRALHEDLASRGYNAVYLPPGLEKGEIKIEKFPITTLVFISHDLLHERKGLKYLLKALFEVKKKGRNFRLLLIGRPSSRLHRLIDKYRLTENIKTVGPLPRERCLEVLSKSHVLVAPSLYEEFGFTVLEAMSVGVPVIASNIFSFQELVTEKTGFLVNIKNRQEFAKKIAILIEDDELRLKMSRNSFERFRENFSWDVLLPKLLKIYEEVTSF